MIKDGTMHLYDIFINHNSKSFYFVESAKPKSYNLAIKMMTHIELIVENNFSYDLNRQDVYSHQSQADLFEILRKKSWQVYEAFNLKQICIRGYSGKFKSKKRQLLKIYHAIEKCFPSPQVFPLPEELIQKIVDYLPISDFSVLTCLNHHAKSHAITALLKRAKEFGYKGKNHTQASEYLNSLFYEVIELNKQGQIPEKWVFYEQIPLSPKKVDVERILQNLKNFSTEDLFLIFSKENAHKSAFQQFREVFALQWKWKATKIDSPGMLKNGESALFLSAKYANKEILQLLLPYNLNLNAQFLNKFTPLTINTSNSDITKMLIMRGASIDHPTNYDRYTALHFASKNGQLETVKVLLEAGANINALTFHGQTPLYVACRFQNKKVVEELLKHQADPNIATWNGFTPLTINTSDPDMTKILIMQGALIDHHMNPEGNTALHFAVQKGLIETVKTLLEASADRNIRNLNGLTPLDIAQKSNISALVSLFKGGFNMRKRWF